MESDNKQTVLTISNIWTYEQVKMVPVTCTAALETNCCPLQASGSEKMGFAK